MYNYIELFGLPASGKSTFLSRKQIESLNNKLILHSNRIIRNLKKLLLLLYIFIFRIDLFFTVQGLFRNVQFKNYKLKIKMYVYLLNILAVIIFSKKRGNSIFYLDEGLLQVLWAICYNSSYNESFINLFFDTFYHFFSKNVIVFLIDSEVNLERLIKRNECGGSELEHDVKIDRTFFDKALKIRNLILDKCTLEKFYIKEVN